MSGGEKARLLFALMTCDKPHILLLDEPTNHLDVLSRQALIQAVNAFEGAVVIVSHDPHIIGLTADRFWLVDGGRVQPYDGDLEDYRAILLSRRKCGNGGNGGTASNSPNKKERRRAAADKRASQAALKKRLTEAEAVVHRLEADKFNLQAALADPKLYDGGKSDKLVNLRKRLSQAERDLKIAEESWVSLREIWEETS